MCGRFTQKYTWEKLQRLYRLTQPARNIRPQYNICPTDPIDAIMPGHGGLLAVPMRWQLIPPWWKKPLKELPATFNARAETVADKPMCVPAQPLRHSSIWLLRVEDHARREAAVLHHVDGRTDIVGRGSVDRVARPGKRRNARHLHDDNHRGEFIHQRDT